MGRCVLFVPRSTISRSDLGSRDMEATENNAYISINHKVVLEHISHEELHRICAVNQFSTGEEFLAHMTQQLLKRNHNNLKGPKFCPFSDLRFPSWTPAEQLHTINDPSKSLSV